MASQTIDIPAADGKRFTGYLSVPAAGRGPGLVLLQEIYGINATIRAAADLFAEEGYVVLAPDLFFRMQPNVELGYDDASRARAMDFYRKFDVNQAVADIGAALHVLKARPECTGKTAAVGFCLGGLLGYLTAARLPVEAAVAFYGGGIEKHLGEAKNVRCPMVLHFGGKDDHIPPAAVQQVKEAFAGRNDVSVFVYPDAGHAFYLPGRASYQKLAAQLAHSPTIGLLRQTIGPRYDLIALWERHCELEFATRDATATMQTMVPQPYVNHIPTMTGGVGYDELHRFYQTHFIPTLPKDTKLVPVSRTVGADRLVDELLFCFTHDREIDWMLPGVAPTGKYVEVPLVAIVCFRGDKLYHEHIYWDQASVLVQIGLLDAKGLPVAGRETARKVADEKQPSNTLMKRWAESAAKGK
jgi:carboxymethylenebutenolidase